MEDELGEKGWRSIAVTSKVSVFPNRNASGTDY